MAPRYLDFKHGPWPRCAAGRKIGRMPLLLLFLAFTVLPLTELWLLLEVKGQIGIGYLSLIHL